jgi:DNA-binding HxlR family transcriptional regulator
MDYDSIPEALQTRLRVLILAAIYNGEKDFNTLKEILSVTDGNLGVQLMKLEQYGCLFVIKTIEGKKSRTIYKISDYGKRIFSEYVNLLRKSVEGGNEEK